MGQKCGEWIENGETVTYDPCTPAPEAVKPSPWFLRMPQLQGPPMAQRLT